MTNIKIIQLNNNLFMADLTDVVYAIYEENEIKAYCFRKVDEIELLYTEDYVLSLEGFKEQCVAWREIL